MKKTALALLVLSTFIIGACSRDPHAVALKAIRKGDKYAEQKQYQEAVIEYRNAIQAEPRSGEARKKLANTFLNMHDISNAAGEYLRAADLLPDDLDVQLAAGGLLQLGGRFDDAKARAEAVLKKEPK